MRMRAGRSCDWVAAVTDFDDPSFFGEQWAADYDAVTVRDPDAEVEFLASLVTSGRVLELAIGTGRVALPLSRRGLAVEGVEASVSMVEQMRRKAGGELLPVTIGDMADVPVEGPYSMVYLIFNTLYNLTTQARQIDCFRGVARVMESGGMFVVEAVVPDPDRWVDGQRLDVYEVTERSVLLSLSRHDRAEQVVTYQRVTLDNAGLRLRPFKMRYVWPSELDLMAQLAGLELTARWGGWAQETFDSRSAQHVSVYRKR